MGVLTDLAEARVKKGVRRLFGKVLTRPALLVSDGVSLTYACDIDIGITDPSGTIDQLQDSLGGLPGQDDWTLEESRTINNILRNVVIARNNADLIYADVGAAVVVERTHNGHWQVTGFSIEQPGTYTLVPVSIGNNTIGTIVDLTIEGRLLTLGELGTFAPFGTLPFGATGIFIGDQLRDIR